MSLPSVFVVVEQDSERHVSLVEQSSERASDLLVPVVEARVVADVPEVLHLVLAGVVDLEIVQFVRPVPASRLRLAEGVPLLHHVLEHAL